MKSFISDNLPMAIGPYVHAKQGNGIVFFSGQLGIDPITNELGKDFSEQVRFAMENIKNLVEEIGTDMDHLIKTTVYMKDMNDFSIFNSIYEKYFTNGFPARTAIEISNLPMGGQIEIEAIVEV